MAMSLGLNIASFAKFVKNRLRLLSNSIKRQAMLIKEIVDQSEKQQSESQTEGKKMKNKINSLKTELKQVMTDLRGQKVSYDEVQAEKKFTKIIEKERETEKVNYQEQIEQPNRPNEPTSDRIEE